MKNKKENAYKQVLTQLIADVFYENDNAPLNYKQVSARLNIGDPDAKNVVAEILAEGVENRKFKAVQKGKYQLRQREVFIIGRVDMTADGSAYIVPDEDDSEGDIYIAPRKLRQALNGDKVKVHVYERKKGQKLEGEVLEIISRAKTQFSGTIELSRNFAFFLADDRKMPHDIFIPLGNLNGAKNGDKAVVEITQWLESAKNPVGKVTHVLGKKGENDTEMHAILSDFGFSINFPKVVEKEADKLKLDLSKKELKKRKDFRKVPTFTIDPADAKDFDDALSFRKTEDGNYEVGIHIADVTHYVQPDSILDKEAFERGNSVYLVDRTIPMLPEKLSNDLCSLVPNEDRLCFSVVVTMNDDAQVLDSWFGRTVIHSDRKFSYEEAQSIIEGEEGPFQNEIRKLTELSKILREKRFKNGAMNFDSDEVYFKLDEKGKPIGVYSRERKEAHKMIEDFMLLANKTVAEFIGKKGKGKGKLGFVYRFHDVPELESLNNFAKFAAKFGHKINVRSGKSASKSLNDLMAKIEGKKEQNVLSTLAVRSMSKAIYTTKHHSHYGLAFDYYTHFTSPIRRYSDMMVHRLLAHYLNGGKNVNTSHYEKMSEHVSQMERKAIEAERASIKYKQAEYLEDQIGGEFKGIISGVTEWGMYVELEENKCEGMVRLRDITDDFYSLDEKNYLIIGQRKKKKYQLGDEVKVRVKKVDLDKRQIDFKLLS